MFESFSGVFGEQYGPIAAFALMLLVAIVVLMIILRIVRGMRGGLLVSGGRKHRLAIVDAAAVDSHRRIVLVRRDDVEHLVMIGGNNDLVIETDIGAKVSPSAIQPPPPAQAKPIAQPARETPPMRASNIAPPKVPSASPQPARKTAPPSASIAAGAGAAAALVPERKAPESEAAERVAQTPPLPQPAREPTMDIRPAKREETPIGTAQTAAEGLSEPQQRQFIEHKEPSFDDQPISNEAPEPDASQDRIDPISASDLTTSESDLEDEMEKLLSQLTGKK